MKDICSKIQENFYNNTVGDPTRLYNYYYCRDGFQFGWSAGVSDKDWFPIFDMNFLRNYYQKYFDPRIVNAGISNINRVHHSVWKKYPRNAHGELYFDSGEAALVFAILNARCLEPDENAIKEALSKFLNKENGVDKDTVITVKKRKSTFKDLDEYRIDIANDRVAPIRRPLYIILMNKEYANL